MSAADPADPVLWHVDAPQGPWAGAMADLDEHGTVLVAGPIATWGEHLPTGSALVRVLGRDAERYATLRTPRLRLHFAATRMLLKHVTAAALCCAPEEIDIGYTPRGRAYVRGQDNAHLSLSHTAGLAVVALSYLGPIGVDVEHSGRDLLNPDVTTLMCTPEERRLLLELEGPLRQAALSRTWTLKEAYSKALGQGLLFPFTQFGFDVSPTARRARLKRLDHSDTDTPFSFHSLQVTPDPTAGTYTLALAAPSPVAHRPETQAATWFNPALFALLRPGI